MMTDERLVMNGNGVKVGDRMDDVLSLSEALNELDLLNAATHPRKEPSFLNDLRLRGLRSTPSLTTFVPLGWRASTCESTKTVTLGTRTKENMEDFVKIPIYTASGGRSTSKVLQPRGNKTRISPYHRRRPLNPIRGRSASCCQLIGHTSTSLVNGGVLTNGLTETYHRPFPVGSLPLIFENQQHQHPLQVRGLSLRTPHHAPFLQEELTGDVLKRKTEGDGSFPVPVLTRSKSLEDLRESIKPKLKSLSTDMTGGSISSFEASALSPRNVRGRVGCDGHSNSFLPFNSSFPRRDFDSESDIKKEIESMSMRIERLDVV